ncbi:Lrp/AsnC family transcriptional regulator [Stappia indica]|uniref:Lrp/AsnC family transcriptional regulator n=1 Tax=Stappia indica TaxID=538381 RepID=UPI001CD52442|nr:Lrp/AsnC family transcriptional regulator [Stappia indica]MCA1298439.1 Lrp/AsnC family transcriptional regulator [Stappia indica]
MIHETGADTSLSEIDRGLIQLLTENARRSNTELAAMLNVSRMTVKNRIDRRVDRGIIEQFTIKVKAGNDESRDGEVAFFHMKLKGSFCKRVYERLKGWPELVGAWSIAGETDMIALVHCLGFDRPEALRERLARFPEVEQVWTAMVLRQWAHKASRAPDYDPRNGLDRLDLHMQELGAAGGDAFSSRTRP